MNKARVTPPPSLIHAGRAPPPLTTPPQLLQRHQRTVRHFEQSPDQNRMPSGGMPRLRAEQKTISQKATMASPF